MGENILQIIHLIRGQHQNIYTYILKKKPYNSIAKKPNNPIEKMGRGSE